MGWSIMTFDDYYMSWLPLIASKSKDPNAQFGAVAVAPDRHTRMTGYNSFVRGLNDDLPGRDKYPEAYKWIEHAERNLIYAAAREGISLKGCKIYVGANPCMDCAKAIVSVGIKEVMFNADGQYNRRKRYMDRGPEHITRYIQEQKDIQQMFKECNVKYTAWYKSVDIND
jgi:dCMP deaminase